MRRQSLMQSLSASTTLLCSIVFALSIGRHECNAGWVDPDTPEEFRTTTADYKEDTREYELVREIILCNMICISFASKMSVFL